MKISALTLKEQPKQKTNLLPAVLAGGAIGSGARYLLPTKAEFSNFFNKENIDTFISSSAVKTRGANRSILAFATVGALLSAGIAKVISHFKNKNQAVETTPQYTKLGALMDASPYACEVVWYED